MPTYGINPVIFTAILNEELNRGQGRGDLVFSWRGLAEHRRYCIIGRVRGARKHYRGGPHHTCDTRLSVDFITPFLYSIRGTFHKDRRTLRTSHIWPVPGIEVEL